MKMLPNVNDGQRQRGLSLIEMMVAILIGTFLLGGAIATFINIKQTYRIQDNLSRLQENGWLALELIGRDIRVTGYWGCLIPSKGDLYGDEARLILKAAFVVAMPTTNCGDSVNQSASYYWDKTSTVIYTLNNAVLRRNTNSINNDIVEGVEAMVFLYGVDTDADSAPNVYVTYNSGVNFEKVVSIKVSLLLSSMDDNLIDKAIPYNFNGTIRTDKRLRRVYSSTFMLRNRHS